METQQNTSNLGIYDATYEIDANENAQVNLSGFSAFPLTTEKKQTILFSQNTTTFFYNELRTFSISNTELNIGDIVNIGDIIGQFENANIISDAIYITLDITDSSIVLRNLMEIYANLFLTVDAYNALRMDDTLIVSKEYGVISTCTVIDIDYVNLVEEKIKVTVKIDNKEKVLYGVTNVTISKVLETDQYVYVLNTLGLGLPLDQASVVEAYILHDDRFLKINIEITAISNIKATVLRVFHNGVLLDLDLGVIEFIYVRTNS
ncbi:MAG: hypothetical protein LBE09_06340 [Christensenellaceae bacterium]|nr:hypothetical protein [Christensenellaceae bacterium]